MNIIDRLVRSMSKQNIIDSASYPLVSDMDFEHMKAMVQKGWRDVFCFPFYRHIDGVQFVDIYIYRVGDLERYCRFVLAEGYTLGETEEKEFLGFLSSEIAFDKGLVTQLVENINNECPKLNLILYWRKADILRHIYYTWHPSGIYELLYKANLECIAVEVSNGNMENINVIGSSPQNIFDVQLGMLRALNSPESARLLCMKENRDVLKTIYAKYHNYIRGRLITPYQCKYLHDIMNGEDVFKKKKYDVLGGVYSECTYHRLLKYWEYKKVVDDYYGLLPEYPGSFDIEYNVEICDMLEWVIEHESYINSRLKYKARERIEKYSYETDKYIIKIPISVSEFLSESVSQHNCLYTYIVSSAFKSTVIAFMRDKVEPDESLVTIEIFLGEICQALNAFNRRLTDEQKEFIKEYASACKLSIRSDVLVDYRYNEDDEDVDWNVNFDDNPYDDDDDDDDEYY